MGNHRWDRQHNLLLEAEPPGELVRVIKSLFGILLLVCLYLARGYFS